MITPEPQLGEPKPGRRFQFSLRTLLLLPVIVPIAGMVYLRIEHNRDQREAVHDLWKMGILTADHPGDIFGGAVFATDMIWHNKEGWFENLMGTHEPIAILLKRPWSPYKAEQIAGIVQRVPSIKCICVKADAVDPDGISEEDLAKLRILLPNVVVDVGNSRPTNDPPLAGSTLGLAVE